MSSVALELKWTFTAEFEDGHFIDQEDDTCLTRVDGTGSRFSDVLAYPQRLTAFHLIQDETGEAVSVDLVTGAFIVNGTPIHVHDQYFDPMDYELDLVYFRETRAEQDLNAMNERIAERHYINRYFIGWETMVNGKNVKQTLAVG